MTYDTIKESEYTMTITINQHYQNEFNLEHYNQFKILYENAALIPIISYRKDGSDKQNRYNPFEGIDDLHPDEVIQGLVNGEYNSVNAKLSNKYLVLDADSSKVLQYIMDNVPGYICAVITSKGAHFYYRQDGNIKPTKAIIDLDILTGDYPVTAIGSHNAGFISEDSRIGPPDRVYTAEMNVEYYKHNSEDGKLSDFVLNEDMVMNARILTQIDIDALEGPINALSGEPDNNVLLNPITEEDFEYGLDTLLLEQSLKTPKLVMGGTTRYIETQALPEFVTYSETGLKEANRHVSFKEFDAKATKDNDEGKIKYKLKELIPVYIRSNKVKVYNNLGFNIDAVKFPNTFDVYSPAVQPTIYDREFSDLMYEFFKDRIPNDKQRNWFLGYMNFIINNPGKLSQKIVILQGRSGSGKTFITRDMLAQCFGVYALPDAGIFDIIGNFNVMAQNKCFAVIDEFPDIEPKDMSLLKKQATAKKMTITKKGVDSIQMDNILNMVGTTDIISNLPSSSNERRVVHVQVSNLPWEDLMIRVLNALGIDLLGEGSGANSNNDARNIGMLVKWIQDIKIENFDIREIVMTEDQSESAMAKETMPVRYFHDMFSHGIDYPITSMKQDVIDIKQVYTDIGWGNDNEFKFKQHVRQMFERIGMPLISKNHGRNKGKFKNVPFYELKKMFITAYGINMGEFEDHSEENKSKTKTTQEFISEMKQDQVIPINRLEKFKQMKRN